MQERPLSWRPKSKSKSRHSSHNCHRESPSKSLSGRKSKSKRPSKSKHKSSSKSRLKTFHRDGSGREGFKSRPEDRFLRSTSEHSHSSKKHRSKSEKRIPSKPAQVNVVLESMNQKPKRRFFGFRRGHSRKPRSVNSKIQEVSFVSETKPGSKSTGQKGESRE